MMWKEKGTIIKCVYWDNLLRKKRTINLTITVSLLLSLPIQNSLYSSLLCDSFLIELVMDCIVPWPC